MKKIGILTFHRANNCGALLQAYALQTYLKKCFYQPIILDYRCDAIEKKYLYKKNLIVLIKCIVKFFIRHKEEIIKIRRKRIFNAFRRNNLVLSKKYKKSNITKANSNFSYFVCGSDQIWNYSITDYDDVYFLSFADKNKRFSYAASFGGNYQIPNAYKTAMLNNLDGFKMISVRETSGLKMLAQIGLSNEKIERTFVSCDPVFLLNKEEWVSFFDNKPKMSNYIFIYFAADQKHSVEFAKKLSKQLKMKVLYFNSFYTKNIDSSFINVTNCGPKEFLNYIYNSSIVITTSFHALAFSIIFNKNVYYELDSKENNNNARLLELSNIFGLHKHEIINNNSSPVDEIDWDEKTKILDLYVEKSKKYFNSF